MKTDPVFLPQDKLRTVPINTVESVTWIDALRFANELSKSEGFEEYSILETVSNGKA